MLEGNILGTFPHQQLMRMKGDTMVRTHTTLVMLKQIRGEINSTKMIMISDHYFSSIIH